MRKLIIILAIAMTVAPGSGQAQMTINMSQVTCANYLAMTPEQSRISPPG